MKTRSRATTPGTGSAYVATAAPAFDRMCSGDLPAATALFNAGTGNGTQEKIYFNGEETTGGRPLAHVVTGSNTGRTYHLAHLGYANYENVILCPAAQDKTIAMMTDDSSDGGVYIYIGTKNNSGATDVEKAGLVGGKLYALKVNGKPFELVGATGTPVVSGDAFTLAQIAVPGYVDGSNAANNDTYPTAGSNTDTRAAAVSGLKMAGPEDGAWDTRVGHTNKFYFNTKGSSSNGIQGPTRLWKLEFTDIANPESGGTISILLDAPDMLPETTPGTRANLDNMAIRQRQAHAARRPRRRCAPGPRLRVRSDDEQTRRSRRLPRQPLLHRRRELMTTDEESSGIISLEDILGSGWFATSAQVHTNTHIPAGDRTELVEGGQLLLLNLTGRSGDFVREKPVTAGSTWKYKTDGTDPGHTGSPKWFDVAYDDSAWSSGATPIGYGDDNETATDLVAPANPKPTSYYFRRTFTLANAADVVYLEVMMQRDDGAVVYINGVEVGRSNVSPNPVLSNTAVAAGTTSNEPNWVYIPVKTEGLTLGATNTIAVSVHQDGNTSSDIRMNCEVIAYNRPAVGTAPITPVGLASGTAGETTVPLTWTAQTDAKVFQLERKRNGDTAWEVLRFDLPGGFTSFSDAQLTAATQYSYRLKAINVFGASAYTTAINVTTATPSAAPVLFQEDFETLTGTVSSPPATTKRLVFSTLSGISTVNVSSDFNWYPAGPFGSQAAGGLGKIVQGNNFGGNAAADDWLILPPLNTAFYNAETFDFKSDCRFDDAGLAGLPNTGPPTNSVGLDVLVSTDYKPAVHTNPSSATWTLLPGYVLDTVTTAFGNGIASGSINLSGIAGIDNGPAYIAFRYRASSGTSARAWEIDQLVLRGNSGLDLETTLAPLNATSVASNLNWAIGNAGARNAALANNFGADVGGEDWLITPRMVTTDVSAAISFDYWQRFADSGQSEPLSILVSTNYDPTVHTNPNSATWTNLTGTVLNGVTDQTWTPLSPVQLGVIGTNVYVAFRYRSSGTGSGTCKQIGVDNIKFYPTTAGGPPVATFAETKNGGQVSFNGTVTGGTAPFTYAWNFGDSTTSALEDPVKTYTAPGTYTVTFTVTDNLGLTSTATKTTGFTFTQFVQAAKAPGALRIESYNAGLNSEAIASNGSTFDASAVANALATTTHASIKKLAEVIQRVNPDIILLNEFDLAYTGQNLDAAGTLTRINNLRNNYLALPQSAGLSGVSFPYHFIPGTNTGIHSGYDLRNNGTVTAAHTNTTASSQDYGDDAFGFGQYPGKYGFVVLSKYPIDTAKARTFQYFLWRDMPGALLPKNANTNTDYYTTDELNVFRLSSKNHCDIPVIVAGQTVHVLASHPTPPVFDDGETLTHPLVTGTNPTKADWNGLRNHDEIRFWADYVNPANSSYIYDDAHLTITGTAAAGNPLYTGVPTGGLPANSRFIILGDENADPVDGDTSFDAILPVLNSPMIDATVAPTSTGALADVPGTFANRATKTSDFNLRADYVLPSSFGWATAPQAGCYWPVSSDLTYHLLGASDHRTVWIDLPIIADGQPPAPVSYDLWWQSYGHFVIGSPNASRTLDVDNDGLNNFAEYLFGTNPNINNTPPMAIEPGVSGAEFVYRRNLGAAAAWSVQTSANLIDWPVAIQGVDYEVVSTILDPQDSNVQIVRIRLLNPSTSATLFVRARAVETP